MGLNFDISQNGFDVKIGEVNFFFETTEGNLLRLIELQETSDEEIKMIDAELAKYDFESMEDPQLVKEALEAAKTKVHLVYDMLLGEGAFNRLYAAYPDINQLFSIYPDVLEGVAAEMGKKAAENKAKSSKKVTELKAKAAKKRKK